MRGRSCARSARIRRSQPASPCSLPGRKPHRCYFLSRRAPGAHTPKSGAMRRLAVLALAAVCTALTLAGAAAADVQIGVVEDGVRGPDPALFLDRLTDIGMTEVRVTISWDPTAPTTIHEQPDIERMLPFAQARGIRVILSIDLANPRAVGNSAPAAGQFAAFTAQVARTFPTVKDIIVGNEPNQTRFWQPQYNSNGTPAACVAYERLLAASYDALKAVDPGIAVIGVGLSPRGNDNPKAKDNVSRSPAGCLRDMGVAYRGSARKKPIMDEHSFHPYPRSNRDAVLTGYQWPNAGVANLDRIKQAFWDAFHGTRQPLFAEGGRAGGVRFRLDEVGWQVRVIDAAAHAYEGTENVQTTDEAFQAQVYAGLIPYLACDPSVRSILYFGLIDEPVLERWQAAFLRADRSERPAYATVKGTYAQTKGRCTGRARAWRHTVSVVGARSTFPRVKRPLPKTNRSWSFSIKASESAKYRAGIFRLKSARLDRRVVTRGLAANRGALRASGSAKAYTTQRVRFARRLLTPGWYAYGVKVSAAMSAARTTTFIGRPFRVGKPTKR